MEDGAPKTWSSFSTWALTWPNPLNICWPLGISTPGQVRPYELNMSACYVIKEVIHLLNLVSPSVYRSRHAAEHRSVCCSWQAQLHSLPVSLPLRAQRSSIRQDENHFCSKAAAGVLGLPVSCPHPRWRALWAHEPHDGQLWDCGTNPAHHIPAYFALFPRWVSQHFKYSDSNGIVSFKFVRF